MRIALVPLDERPVNTDIPRQVAAIAGAELVLPPAEAMPDFRTPGDVQAIGSWLREIAPAVDHVVACVDTLVFGGIIPARITHEPVTDALQRLEILRELAAIPGLDVTAASLIMRASNSDSNVEEPEYWDRHGRALHRLGASLHRALVADATGHEGEAAPSAAAPEGVLADFELRRLRNHIVNLAALGLYEEGVLHTLALTADDTAPHSAGSAEQLWLRHWMRALPHGHRVLMYPGADEVGAVFVARAILSGLPQPRWRVVCGESDGLERVPNFENVPVRSGIERQIRASGGRIAAADENAELVLVVHAPDPERGDFFMTRPHSDEAATRVAVDAVESALETGAIVALADVRFSNGGDPQLVNALAARGLLLELSAYAGWNTAGNSIGSAVAQATAVWAGRSRGTANESEIARALLTRILDDCAYQSVIRLAMHEAEFAGRIGPLPDADRAAAELRIAFELQQYLRTTLSPATGWSVERVVLPWGRSFEIAVELAQPDGISQPAPHRGR